MATPTFRQISEHAVLQMEAGNWDAAREHWLSALALVPDSAEVMLELSYTESSADQYRVARDWALRAAKAPPRSIDAVMTLMQRLRTFNEVPTLRGIAAALSGRQQAPTALLVECARHLSNLNDFDVALRCAQAAVAKAPADWSARLVRGQLLANYGRTEEAADDFEWVAQRYPGLAMAWWLLSRLRKQTVQSNHVLQLRTLLQAPELQLDDAAVAARALHKELDDIGNYDDAWQALETMCRARRSTIRYDAMEGHRLIDRLIVSSSDGGTTAELQETGKIPIFIVGMYRSGTTLMEQLLDASPDVHGLGELTDFASAMRYATNHYCKGAIDTTVVERAPTIDFTEVGRRYMAGIAWRLGDERFFSDKLPSNFLNIGFICRALPQAKILHMVRDPIETCFSNLRELFSEVNPYSYDQLELADYFKQYRRLMEHWHAAYPGRILDVHYADLTRNTEAAMREVAAFCGIDYVDAMSDPRSSKRPVATASAVQVRDKVVVREQPRWKPYEQYLQPLIQALRSDGFVQ
jgi:tetratricopeptide (TPR) repeat protein